MHYAADVKDVIYRYDGSFQGFLCCVFESYARREIPSAICAPQQEQISLFEPRQILTEEQKARRVFAGAGRLGGQVKYRLTTGFLETLDEGERSAFMVTMAKFYDFIFGLNCEQE